MENILPHYARAELRNGSYANDYVGYANSGNSDQMP